MGQTGSPNKGDVENWQDITDVVVQDIAASENVADGDMVYQDAANGIKKVPITGVSANRIRFCPTGFDNSSGALGDRELETVKHGAIVVAQCDGAITVGTAVTHGQTTAGRVQQTTTTPVGSDTQIGRYLGHVGEVGETGNEPTDAADGDLVLIQML